MVKLDYEKLWNAMRDIVSMNVQYNRNLCNIYSSCNTEKKPPEHALNAFYVWAEAEEIMSSLEDQIKNETPDTDDEDKMQIVEPTQEDEDNVELNEEYE